MLALHCVNCGAPTEIGKGYALPFIVRAGDAYQNLYACSRACRDEWRAAQQEVKQIQADMSARMNHIRTKGGILE